MFIIGIDPHRGSHMVVAIDRDERIVATIELPANQQQRRRLLTWARPLEGFEVPKFDPSPFEIDWHGLRWGS